MDTNKNAVEILSNMIYKRYNTSFAESDNSIDKENVKDGVELYRKYIASYRDYINKINKYISSSNPDMEIEVKTKLPKKPYTIIEELHKSWNMYIANNDVYTGSTQTTMETITIAPIQLEYVEYTNVAHYLQYLADIIIIMKEFANDLLTLLNQLDTVFSTIQYDTSDFFRAVEGVKIVRKFIIEYVRYGEYFRDIIEED